MQRSCASWLGTVRPGVAPSWFTAVPRITAQIRSAVGHGLAESLQDQDAATLPPHVTVRPRVEGGAPSVRRQHPGVRAHFEQLGRQDRVHAARQRQIRLSPVQPGHRWWIATSDEEQAVSRAMAGPFNPNAKATRPMAVLKDVPVTE